MTKELSIIKNHLYESCFRLYADGDRSIVKSRKLGFYFFDEYKIKINRKTYFVGKVFLSDLGMYMLYVCGSGGKYINDGDLLVDILNEVNIRTIVV